jgi:hypothetical protein
MGAVALSSRKKRFKRTSAASFQPSPIDATVYKTSEPVVVQQRRRLARRPGSATMVIRAVVLGLLLFIALPISCAYYLYNSIHAHNQPVAPSAAIGQPISTPQQTQTTPATSVAIAATSGTPLLSDPLESNTTGRWAEDSSHCIFTGGTYHITVTQTNFLQHCLLLAPSLDNAAVQVDASLLSGHDVGLLLRVNGDRFYSFEINRQGQFFFLRHDPGGNTPLIPSTPSKAIAPPGQKNTLLVIARGDDFKLYINDVFVGEAHDNTYASGYIALAAGTQAPQLVGEGSFANFELFKIAA